jgi:hypothetical protein
MTEEKNKTYFVSAFVGGSVIEVREIKKADLEL